MSPDGLEIEKNPVYKPIENMALTLSRAGKPVWATGSDKETTIPVPEITKLIKIGKTLGLSPEKILAAIEAGTLKAKQEQAQSVEQINKSAENLTALQQERERLKQDFMKWYSGI
jgi:hypothetical protein